MKYLKLFEMLGSFNKDDIKKELEEYLENEYIERFEDDIPVGEDPIEDIILFMDGDQTTYDPDLGFDLCGREAFMYHIIKKMGFEELITKCLNEILADKLTYDSYLSHKKELDEQFKIPDWVKRGEQTNLLD